MAEPGPEAFVVGRVGLPKSLDGFEKLLMVSDSASIPATTPDGQLLQTQLVMDQICDSIFQPSSMDKSSEGDSEVDLDDLSLRESPWVTVADTAAPQAVPITVSLHQCAIRLSFPLGEEATLSLAVSPTTTAPFVEIQWNASAPLPDDRMARIEQGVQLAKEQGTDAVGVVRVVLEHCR